MPAVVEQLLEMQTRSHSSPQPSLLRASALAAAMLVFASGCPGQIDNPGKFRDALSAASFECSLGIDVPMLLAERCSGDVCHSAETPAAGLDLTSPNLASRVVGVAASGCEGQVLVSPEGATRSLLFGKLGPNPACGSPMPLGGDPLSADEVECVGAWIADVTTSGGDVDAAPAVDAQPGVDAPAVDAGQSPDGMPAPDAM